MVAVRFLRFILVSLLLLFYYSAVSLAMGLSSQNTLQSQNILQNTLLALVCFLQTAVMSYPIVRSQYNGLKLILATFVIFFGVATFLTQIETVVFLRYLVEIVPVEEIPKLFLQGLIVAALFSISAVAVYGKLRGKDEHDIGREIRVERFSGALLSRLLATAVIYVPLYILFGMFVAMPLGGEAFQEYYAGLQLPPWILPFQVIRGVIWAFLALAIMWVMEGGWWEKAISVALIFSVLPASFLLLPNPYMPEQVRFAHFVEILSSNFLFGLIAAWLLKSPIGKPGVVPR
jgi:hypothetical protein